MINEQVISKFVQYATDRDAFYKTTDPLLAASIDYSMMGAESRPHGAEHVAIKVMGHKIFSGKKYDGEFYDGTRKRYSEYKVTCRKTNDRGETTSMSAIGHNDVTADIVARYDADQPLFVFPFFIDGHLAAMFSVDYAVLRPKYAAFLSKVKPSRSVLLSLKDWLDESTVEYVHSDPEVVSKLAPSLLARIKGGSMKRGAGVSNIVCFPEGHKYSSYGFDLGTDEMISFKTDAAGRRLTGINSFPANQKFQARYGVKYITRKAMREEAEVLAGKDAQWKQIQQATMGRVIPQITSMPVMSSNDVTKVAVELPSNMTVSELSALLSGHGVKIVL